MPTSLGVLVTYWNWYTESGDFLQRWLWDIPALRVSAESWLVHEAQYHLSRAAEQMKLKRLELVKLVAGGEY